MTESAAHAKNYITRLLVFTALCPSNNGGVAFSVGKVPANAVRKFCLESH